MFSVDKQMFIKNEIATQNDDYWYSNFSFLINAKKLIGI